MMPLLRVLAVFVVGVFRSRIALQRPSRAGRTPGPPASGTNASPTTTRRSGYSDEPGATGSIGDTPPIDAAVPGSRDAATHVIGIG